MTMTAPAPWRAALNFSLADRMKKTLEASETPVYKIAEYMGVSRGTIGNWINGRIHPDVRTLLLWAHLFNVPVSWLESGEWPSGWEYPELSAEDVRVLLETRMAPSVDGADSNNVRPKGFEPPTF